jgi:HlyD family secretion protein
MKLGITLAMRGAAAACWRVRRLAAVWLSLSVWAAASQPPAHAQVPPAPVVVARVVEVAYVLAEESFVGTVEPTRRALVGSAVDGRVAELLVREGDHVLAGKALARLQTTAIEIQIAAARARLAEAEQKLAELEAGTRPEELAEAEARRAGAEARMRYAKARAERTRQLRQRNSASIEQEQEDAAAAEEAEAAWKQADATYRLLLAGPRAEQIEQARAAAAAAAEEVKRLEDQLAKHTIISPFEGYVVQELTEEGQWIRQGELVAEVVEISQLDVVVSVPEHFIPRLALGQPAQVELEAWPGEPVRGVIQALVPQADQASRSFPVKIRVSNSVDPQRGLPRLMPGMFARAALAVAERHHARLIPKDALVLGGPQPHLFVVTARRGAPARVRQVTVDVGLAVGELIELRSELKAGTQIVVEGNERLRDGQEVEIVRQIEVQPPAAPQPGTADAAGRGSAAKADSPADGTPAEKQQGVAARAKPPASPRRAQQRREGEVER